MAEYIKRMDTFSDEMCEGIDCGVCPFYNKAGENDCQVVAFLRSIPAAEVRPVKRGRWISENDGKTEVRMTYGEPQESCRCSSCGEWLVGSDEYAVKGNFCPNCGADMREES